MKSFWQIYNFNVVMEGKLGRKFRCGNEVKDNWLQEADGVLQILFWIAIRP